MGKKIGRTGGKERGGGENGQKGREGQGEGRKRRWRVEKKNE